MVDYYEFVVVRLVPDEKKLTNRDGQIVCVFFFIMGLVSAISFLIQLLHHLCLPGFVTPGDKPLKA